MAFEAVLQLLRMVLGNRSLSGLLCHLPGFTAVFVTKVTGETPWFRDTSTKRTGVITEEVRSDFAELLELNFEAERLVATKPWTKGYTSKVLLKTPDLRLVLIAMQAGSRIHQHRSEGRIAVHCLKGVVRLQLPNEGKELRTDDLLALDRKVEHDVQALEDSVFLLTICLPAS
jgi:quercetin dioxygenase-like cupin family protein